MDNGLVATSSVEINSSSTEVWDALTNPEKIRRYMFGGTTINSDWKAGSKITWSGEWKGKKYEDKGTIIKFIPEKLLVYSHFSPLSGLADSPENYHKITVELSNVDNKIKVLLSQDNNLSETEREHSVNNWNMMLAELKKFLEK